MSETNNCPKCSSQYVYQDQNLWVCPECSHEWSVHTEGAESSEASKDDGVIKDANGNILQDGDAVIVIKDLKLKGSSGVIKGGTKVKSIRLTDAGDGHDIACKIDGFGAINLKSEFVRKA